MEISLSLSLTGRLLSSAFSPALLFALAEPGVWYDPSDVANLAWRRNLLTWTEQFDNAAWTKTNSSITANAVSAPDGTTTADKLVENTANSTHTASQAFTTSASTSYTFTVYAKADTRSYLDLSALTGFTTNPIVRFTLSGSGASSVRQGSPTPTHSIQSVGDGWYRCQINVTTVAGGSSTFQVALAVDASSSNFYTGDGTSGLFLWGAQLELGSVATDYQRITDVNTEVIERFPTATLYQDTAGTQPVTTPGQTVALALDKSKGLVLGSELVTNGDFSSGSTGWTATGSATLSVVSGRLRVENSTTTTAGATQIINTVAGKTYLWTYYVDPATSGGAVIRVRDGGTLTVISTATRTVAGTYSLYFVATSSTTQINCINSSSTVGAYHEIDNISVRELPGFHATQATAASRPTYGIVPLGGRRNLLTRTEEFDAAGWDKFDGSTSTARTITFAAASGSRIVRNVTSATTPASFTASVLFSSADAGKTITLAIWTSTLNGLSSGRSPNITIPASGLVTYTWVSGLAGLSVFGILTDTSGGAKTVTLAANGGAQLETGSSATAYQRVGSAFDVTEAGVDSLSYLSFDGVDDFLVTPTITPGVDKAQVFAGVRKLSDAAQGMIAEMSANSSANAGSFFLIGPRANATANYGFNSRGTVAVDATSPSSFASPVTNVLTGIGDISGDIVRLRVNGSQVAETLTDQGTGNFLAYPLYIGRRGGTTLPFNGQLYSLLVRFGANLDANTITSTETWVNGKTGAYA